MSVMEIPMDKRIEAIIRSQKQYHDQQAKRDPLERAEGEEIAQWVDRMYESIPKDEWLLVKLKTPAKLPRGGGVQNNMPQDICRFAEPILQYLASQGTKFDLLEDDQ